MKLPRQAKVSNVEKGVPALARGSRILDIVAATDESLTASDIARELDLPKSTVHGLCSTFVGLGLLIRRGDNSYRIGPHVMRWASAFLDQTNLPAEFLALWDNLKVLTNETITLSILDGTEVVYIACRNSTDPLGITFRIGMRLPVQFTATGKAILSTMRAEEVSTLLSGEWPAPLTSRSVRDMDELVRELEEARERGFSIDDGQTRMGMYCFGAPVRDSTNKVVAGVAVSILANKVDAGMTQTAAQCIQTIAQKLSLRLGADASALPVISAYMPSARKRIA